MADSEQSYPDRTQKAQNLKDACAGFTPIYVAAPGGVTLPVFQSKIDTCDQLISNVGVADANLSDAINRRVDMVDDIRETSTDLLAYIKTAPAWKAKYPQAKKLADAIRGVKTPRKPVVEPAPGQPAPRQNQRGGQSYAEIEKNWSALVNLAISLPGFAPPNAAISTETISALDSSMQELNEEISVKEGALSEARKLRQAGFYDDGGLEDNFRDVKANVKGQYGINSTQWAQVKGMKW